MLDRLVYERFGSKSGLTRFLGYWLLARLGAYRKFSPALPTENQRLVFICSGNICRSPLAEAYARSLGREAKSCGLDCRDGFPADPRVIEFASRHGLDLEQHTTANVKSFDFYDTDLIIVMEPSHITSFQNKVGTVHALALAGHYCDRPTPYIHDPFNCCKEFFDNCEYKIMEAVRKICA